jgi:hypothetical protein
MPSKAIECVVENEEEKHITRLHPTSRFSSFHDLSLAQPLAYSQVDVRIRGGSSGSARRGPPGGQAESLMHGGAGVPCWLPLLVDGRLGAQV